MSPAYFSRPALKSAAGVAFALFASWLLVACGGDGVTQTPRYTIGGSVSGLVGSGLVLQDNGGDNLKVSASGVITFGTPLVNGSSYSISVATQPTDPTQTCVVTGATGTVAGANVTSVAVACSTNGYTLGGTISGLVGSGLVLANGGDVLPVSANGNFTFSTTVGSGIAYDVTVQTQPTNPTQVCTVANGSGTMGSANVANVTVTCTTGVFTVGGTVSGLAGTGLILEDNSGDDLPITANGTFTFATPVASGATYAVAVKSSPVNPTQSCAITNGTGTIGAANITNVTVVCAIATYTVGGSVSGLTGTGLIIKTNGANAVSVSGPGNFIFATLASGTAYTVTVGAQPTNPSQVCVVTGGTGTVTTANVTNVVVTCTTNSYTVGGTATGVAGTGLTLLNNNANPVAVTGNGAFTVATVASGTQYAVTVGTQPTNPSQTCVVTNGTGTVTNANVTTIALACTTNNYAVGGTVSGLSGSGLAVENGVGGTAIPVTGNGAKTYLSLASGTAYNIMIKTQPTTPSQTCVVANPTGTVTNAAITNVNISCTTNYYTVSGTVSGLNGSGLVLQDNGGDNKSILANGNFTFATSLVNGAAYAVTVQTQPQTPAQYCVVTNGTGNIAAANVTNVGVSCRNEGIYAYAADNAAGAVSSFAIAPITGALSYVNSQSTSSPTSQPNGIAVEVLPGGAGTYVYTADYGSADISIFSVAPLTGALTYVGTESTGAAPTGPLVAGSTPTAITIDPSGNFALVVDSQNGVGNGEILVYQIDQVAGTLSPVAGNPYLTTDMVSPGNNTSFVAMTVQNGATYAYATNQYAPSTGVAGFIFNDPSSGNLTNTTPWQVATGNNPVWITVDPAGPFVYVSNTTDGTLSSYSIGVGGALTVINAAIPVGVGSNPVGIAIDYTGRFMYVADNANNEIYGFLINATSGALTAMTGSPFPTPGTGGGGLGPVSVNVDPSGHFVYVGNASDGTISEYTADPNTGALTPVGGSPLVYNDAGGPPTTTPAQGTNALAVE